MVGFLGFGIFLVGAVCSSSYTPVPDTSTECLECQSYVKELDLEWTNETTVVFQPLLLTLTLTLYTLESLCTLNTLYTLYTLYNTLHRRLSHPH